MIYRWNRKWAAALSLTTASCLSATAPEVRPVGGPGVASVTLESGLRVHAFRTGWVRVKSAHRELSGLSGLRFLRVILDATWAPWMPIVVYAVERPEGVLLIDTGPSLGVLEPGYFDCDPGNAFFYGRNLRFALPPEERIDRRLAAVGLAPEAVDAIVVTHFHADHVGELSRFPRARVLTGEGNFPSHVGLARCTLPASLEVKMPALADGPFGGFGASLALSASAPVRLVPLPGHTPGHVGVAVERPARGPLLFVGDATFDCDQTERGGVAGVTEDIGAARTTQADLRKMQAAGALLFPSHDPDALARLSALGSRAAQERPGDGG